MNDSEILATLRKLGKPHTAAIYKRHGAGEDVFGVLTSEIGKLQKKIKRDHALAMRLWRTGNVEARILALQIADPGQLTAAQATAFVAEGATRFVCCYLSALVAKSPIAGGVMAKWMKSSEDLVRETGYGIFAARLKDDTDAVSDADAERILATIEKQIHASPNFARYAMNTALIAIGIYKPSLRKKAVAAAKRIGKVDVDHGETSCKTPDAASYIEKAGKRKICP
jgi:3-methyladenine DNA glycosylase AlkD